MGKEATSKLTNSEIEKCVKEKLGEMDIWPFFVICTSAFEECGKLLAISLRIDTEIDEILDKIEYKYLCDKSGVLIIRKSNTIILTGTALIQSILKL